jgi:CubicO group peptidase (beta-lactamase class C family)
MASSPIARAEKSLDGDTHGIRASLDGFGNARKAQNHAYVEAYEILGHVIESVSGIPLTDYIEENVFTLLDMRDSYFSVSGAARDRLARLYSPLFRTFNTPGIPMRHQRNDILPRQIKNFGLEIANPYPSRRLITTARDYQKLLSFLLNPIVEQPSYLNSYKSVISSNLLVTLDIGSHKNGESSEGNSGIEEDGDVDVLPKMLGSERTRRYHFFESEFNTAFWIDTKTGSTAVFMTQLYPSHGLPQDKLHQLINEFTDHN